jgi:hypothetical protein
MGPISSPESSVKDYLSTLRNIPEKADVINIAEDASNHE